MVLILLTRVIITLFQKTGGKSFFMSTALDIIGIVLTIIGFIIVIIDTKKSKKEIKNARLDIFRYNASNDLSNVISNLEEIKRNHRTAHNHNLLDLYSNLRKTIISIKKMYPDLSDEQKKTLQRALQFTKDMELFLELELRENPQFLVPPKKTSLLSEQIDILYELSLDLRNREEK